MRIVRPEADETNDDAIEIVHVERGAHAAPEPSVELFGLSALIRERVEQELHERFGRLAEKATPHAAAVEADDDETLAGKFE